DLALGKRVYVTDINPDTNVITIGEKKDLISTTCRAKNINLSKYAEVPGGEMEITGAIRYNDDGVIGHLRQLGDDEIEVSFPTGREAIAPGQAVVCYEGSDVIAGGWIHKVNVDMEALQET
ncbi:MAG TPA: aminomethyltransferase beta-barrel domain-containing protein, partial [Fodinibius sp.]|nr:aminomethyltransferase beta-barrel domain-containing protein [Fodinibius sp.]